MVRGLEGKPHEEWLRPLGVSSLYRDQTSLGSTASHEEQLQSLLCRTVTGPKGMMEMCQEKFRLAVRKKVFSHRVVGH